MLVQKIRKTGNSYAVTIPREDLEVQGIHEGDYVGIEIRKMVLKPEMSPKVRLSFDKVAGEYRDAIDYLADR